MAASSPLGRPRSSPHSNDNAELQRYAKYLFYKTAQIVVQSRQGGRTFTESQPSPVNQSWFCLNVVDNGEIAHESRKAAGGGGGGVLGQSLCVEISLKTIEGDSLVLENWVLGWRDGSDPSVRLSNAVYNHLGMLLKSALCVTRATPAYRLSRRQGPETFVVCYRIFPGEPPSSSANLGDGFQTATVGQVVTGLGTVQLRVDYRTQMTITPNCSSSGQSLYANLNSGGGGGNAASTMPILCKSDHFVNDDGASAAAAGRGGGPRHHQQPLFGHRLRRTGFASESEQQTSDESQEAIKIFAASPPDPTSPHFKRNFHQLQARQHQQPAYTSSNESLSSGQQHRPFRPRSGTNQSVGSNSSGSAGGVELKLGAFVSRPVAAAAAVAGNAAHDDDPLMQLFSLDVSEEKDPPAAAVEQPPPPPSPSPQQQPAAAAKQKKEDFVLLDFKVPFSARNADNLNSDLGIFFKDAKAAVESSCLSLEAEKPAKEPPQGSSRRRPSLPSAINLEEQLSSFTDQLSSFESNLQDFDEMLKTMEAAATSESESEVY